MILADFFQYEFVQRAVVAGLLISLMSSVLGIFVVQRKMSFLGSGLSHSALGGVGLGIFLGIEPVFIAVPFTLVVALLIFVLREKTKLEIDTSIGVFFSASMALGIIFVASSSGFVGDAYSYLFGSILAISNTDVLLAFITTIVIFILIIKYWKNFTYSTFDRELAISDGIDATKEDYILSGLLALAIVISVKLVGIVLISAFLILPAATAKLNTNTFSKITIFTVIFSVVTCIFGLLLSFVLDFPTGATIILLQTIVFIVSIIYKKFIRV